MPNRGTIYNALGTTQYAQATVASYPIVNPLFTGGYVFSDHQIPGSVTAYNHLALYNPIGSGKTVILAGVFVSSYTEGAVAGVDPLRGWLATNISGGTLEASSAIGKVRSTMPNAVAQVYTENPTATLGAAWFNSPATRSTAASSSAFVHQIPAAIPAGAITLLPGEGTVIRSETGDTDQRWNISIAWSEL